MKTSKPKEMFTVPRQYSWVKFADKILIENCDYPKQFHKDLIFIGEIPNMPSHCIVMSKKGKMFVGYHTDNFQELNEEET